MDEIQQSQKPAALHQLVPGVDIIEPIGRGGFSVVYRATQRAVGREVAVKIDSRTVDDDRNRRRFIREASASSRISGHPHVVSLIDVGTTSDNRPYLVMEYCPNGSLAALLKETGPLRPDEARNLALAICSALSAAHEVGILHRDIKPANILIDAYGTPRLSDFGLAAVPKPEGDPSVTLEALTPAYASPEAFGFSEPSPQSDVWSMGATIYAMISSRSPRKQPDGSPASVEYLMAHLADTFPDPEVPHSDALMQVIRKATAYDPAERYANGGELYEALKSANIADQPNARVQGGPEATFTQLPRTLALHELAQPKAGGAKPKKATWLVASVVGAVLGATGATLFAGTDLAQDLLGGGPAATNSPDGSAGNSAAPESPINPTSNSAEPTSGAATNECFGGIVESAGQVAAQPLDCAEPHFWEGFASGAFDPSTTSPLSDQIAADTSVRETCNKKALKTYLGEKRKGLEIAVLPPSASEWTEGNRTFLCVASERGAGEVTGSLLGE
jgi:eukaryotic-like serine/threonine-protein kinase